MKKEVNTGYIPALDMTIIFEDCYNEENKQISTEVVGFYYGMPNEKVTNYYKKPNIKDTNTVDLELNDLFVELKDVSRANTTELIDWFRDLDVEYQQKALYLNNEAISTENHLKAKFEV